MIVDIVGVLMSILWITISVLTAIGFWLILKHIAEAAKQHNENLKIAKAEMERFNAAARALIEDRSIPDGVADFVYGLAYEVGHRGLAEQVVRHLTRPCSTIEEMLPEAEALDAAQWALLRDAVDGAVKSSVFVHVRTEHLSRQLYEITPDAMIRYVYRARSHI